LLPAKGADIEALVKAAETVVRANGAQTLETVKTVSALVASAEQCPPRDEDFKEACDRCLDVKAPAVRKSRSAVGDCLLWLSVLHHLETQEVIFCTTNKNDFSDTREHELHADLASEAKAAKNPLKYFHDPTALIRHLDTAGTKVPEYFHEVPGMLNIQHCPQCGGALEDGAYLQSRYGGLTYHRFCKACRAQVDTGEWFD
jgi:hypothetical protein